MFETVDWGQNLSDFEQKSTDGLDLKQQNVFTCLFSCTFIPIIIVQTLNVS